MAMVWGFIITAIVWGIALTIRWYKAPSRPTLELVKNSLPEMKEALNPPKPKRLYSYERIRKKWNEIIKKKWE